MINAVLKYYVHPFHVYLIPGIIIPANDNIWRIR